ncbi:hypothetical protein RHMOL_Rhmol03G0284300 [Rhododendron molle]|uniref:Uncharacterized protein n=1 Tax=Rhododendron molle TaxID=49168 RepID=A0ACC0PJG5_RHOML|nr:hypothetical protein RHMOL_Rhmol03G0284300 [Rhododendron molle]
MVVLKTCCTIKPAEPTPTSGIVISDCDQDKPITHAPLIYIYHPSCDFSYKSALESIKISLSKVLVHFYPLAGRLKWIGNGSRVELECNSVGARLYEAELDAELAEFGDFCPTPDLRSLIPSVDYDAPLHEIPLLLVQITRFRCGGLSLGLATSHIMVDGTSFSHFMSMWARIACGEPLGVLPFLDRTVLLAQDRPTRRYNHERFEPPPLLMGLSNNDEERNKRTTVAMLHLSKTHVEKLKNMANDRRAANAKLYSRYEAVAGHLWRCTCKAREHKGEQITKLYLQVNIRDRMKPPLPRGYFGNAFLRVVATSRAGELMTKPFSYGPSKIREAIEMVTDDYVKSALDLVKGLPNLTRFRTYHTVGSTQGAFYGNPNLEITSWLGLPLKGIDFGWGKEIHAGPGSVAFDGKTFIMDGPNEDGSLIVALRLQVGHMDTLRELFYKDIDDWCCYDNEFEDVSIVRPNDFYQSRDADGATNW